MSQSIHSELSTLVSTAHPAIWDPGEGQPVSSTLWKVDDSSQTMSLVEDLPCWSPDRIRSGSTLGQGSPSALIPRPLLSDLREPRPDRYQMLRILGRGATGEVWRVCDTEHNKCLAMKIFRGHLLWDAKSIQRFLLEAHATAQLEHPAVVQVHDLGRLADGRPYFTMSEVQGVRFTELILAVHRYRPTTRSNTQRGLQTLIKILLAICEAITHAHAKGLIHRDLKPGNIMVGENGQVSVLDWGLAKPLRQEPPTPTRKHPTAAWTAHKPTGRFQTQEGTVTGTPAYMAPEQARGATDQHDARTDVYALGAILYLVLSGRTPYSSSTPRGMISHILAGPPRPLAAGPAQPHGLVSICNRATAWAPDDRYPCAQTLLGDIHAWLQRDQAQTRPAAMSLGA